MAFVVLDILTVVDPEKIATQGIACVKSKLKQCSDSKGLTYSRTKRKRFWQYFAKTWLALSHRTYVAVGTPHVTPLQFVRVVEEIAREDVVLRRSIISGDATAPVRPNLRFPRVTALPNIDNIEDSVMITIFPTISTVTVMQISNCPVMNLKFCTTLPSNALNDGTANYDMLIFMESSNSSPIGFGLQLSNATNATSANSAYFGITTTNDLVLMTGNTRRLTITSAGRVGNGTGSPNGPLQVAGSNTSITYYTTSNAWANRGGGPFTLTNVSSFLGGNIYIQAGIWATSDRRLKEDIKEIDLPFERYKDLKPVSYSYKNEAKKRVGWIAQDVMRVCSEAITMIENRNLNDEGENSPEGVQLCLDYNANDIEC
ncbi:Hypothetical protein PHPALM_11747 [Phytophthora palmivora]|uniref:Peptidase S74 domain-containing protein n=1 Tax=Phytophthora palmivora TaxID=4796 RepID=A0A2P4Y1H4_9STRA|nr:Hypothetical protein PHPALM_11747 [Phytophthora palmivora]